jgi:hypothetical protein
MAERSRQPNSGFRPEHNVASNDDTNPEQHSMASDTIAAMSDPTAISGSVRSGTASGTAAAGTIEADKSGPLNDDDFTIEVGADVIGTCGHKIGEVVAVRDDDVVVEKGFFMPVDFYIPKSAIHHNNEHGLYLNVTKSEALHHGWDIDPQQARRAS